MFKFELGQIIFYLRDNKVHSAPVLSRMHVENKDNSRQFTSAQRSLHQYWGLSGTQYRTVHGLVKEEHAFSSKQELAEALISNDGIGFITEAKDY